MLLISFEQETGFELHNTLVSSIHEMKSEVQHGAVFQGVPNPYRKRRLYAVALWKRAGFLLRSLLYQLLFYLIQSEFVRPRRGGWYR